MDGEREARTAALILYTIVQYSMVQYSTVQAGGQDFRGPLWG